MYFKLKQLFSVYIKCNSKERIQQKNIQEQTKFIQIIYGKSYLKLCQKYQSYDLIKQLFELEFWIGVKNGTNVQRSLRQLLKKTSCRKTSCLAKNNKTYFPYNLFLNFSLKNIFIHKQNIDYQSDVKKLYILLRRLCKCKWSQFNF